MSKRFTDTDKWSDPWFRKLSTPEKLVFLYLCDTCDLAGFKEIDEEAIAFHIGITIKQAMDALRGLHKGVKVSEGYAWVVKFMEHQKNLPLNPQNNAHKHIIHLISKRLSLFPSLPAKLGADMGLFSPIGIGKGKGKGRGKDKNKGNRKLPTLKEWVEYFEENGYDKAIAENSWYAYDDADWHDTSGKPVLSWKQKARVVWFKPENKKRNDPNNLKLAY